MACAEVQGSNAAMVAVIAAIRAFERERNCCTAAGLHKLSRWGNPEEKLFPSECLALPDGHSFH